jgi:DNA mismatch repair protein MutL
MGKIRILSDDIISKIAAGEVVERPASVVKELLENSIDARSTEIKIELKNGGKKLVSVTDNGEGMTRDDALLSLERHATSKIRGSQDLFFIKTLGFRGEALPSIAAVSRFRLTTKVNDEISGTQITIDGGTIKRVEEIGCPTGTTVEVRDLFYNVQPRLKFMKTPETELSNALDMIQREALSHPDVGIEITHEGRTLLRLPRRKRMEERFPEFFPNIDLFEIKAEAQGVKVYGFMSSPEDERTTTQKLYTYVNGRTLRDRFLTRTVIESYGRLIERGKFPQGVLLIEIPVEEVDVNVHPTKNEVRFRRARLVGDLIKAGVGEMLRNAPWIKDYHSRVENAVRGFYERRGIFEIPQDQDKRASLVSNIPEINEKNTVIKTTYNQLSETANEMLPSQEHFPMRPSSREEVNHQKLFREGFFSTLEVIGQLRELYIICSSERGMILIDQHAAHERINYEKLKDAYMTRELQTQELLFPLLVELAPDEAQLLRQHKEEIDPLGIKLEEFGKGSFLIRSIPVILKDADIEKLLKDIIGEIFSLGREKGLSERIDHIIATMACHSSIRSGDELNHEKMKAILRELDCARFPHSCPHGRPVAKELTFDELESMFKRS